MSTTALPKLPSNLLIAALSAKDRMQLGGIMAKVELRTSEVLFERGDRVRYVYFPLDCILSILATADEHSMVEIAMIGREGAVGYIEAIGSRVTASRVVVAQGGAALRIAVPQIIQLLALSNTLRDTLNQYLFSYVSQLAQTIACTRFHRVEQRLARWLLMADDRMSSQNFSMTQDSLAILLGVRRVGISAAAMLFKTKRLIDYKRGQLQVVDRLALEAETCTCYRANLATYDRFLDARRVGAR